MKYYLISGGIFAVVGIGSLMSRHFGWYNSYWFTDIILHTLSGIAFGVFWLKISRDTSRSLVVLGATSFATLGSVVWEFWEFGGWKIVGRLAPFYVPQLSDTLGDIACGMIGGFLISILVATLKRKTA